MKQESEKKSEEPTPIEITCSIQALKRFIHRGKETGIGVTVIAQAGESYSELVLKDGEKKLSIATVPEGMVRIEASNWVGLMGF
jgi:hypothetical protein